MKIKHAILIAAILMLPKSGMAVTVKSTYQCPAIDHITSTVRTDTLSFSYRVSLPTFSEAWIGYHSNKPILFCRYGLAGDSHALTLNASLPASNHNCTFPDHATSCDGSVESCVLSCKENQ